MDWVHQYEPGQVRAACSVCGCSRRFPDNLTYCVDKLFRCERCMETTALELDQKIQAYRMQPDELESRVGLEPQGDVPSTFLADAVTGREQWIPGWTPATEFYDDFTVVPGGVGSSWTVAVLTGDATVTQPEAGVARLSSGDTGTAYVHVLSITVPLPSAGNFYCRARFRVTNAGSLNAACGVGARSLDNWFVYAGLRRASSTAFYTFRSWSQNVVSDAQVDSSAYVVAEVWWRSGATAARASIDGGQQVISSVPATASYNPAIFASLPAGMVMDVTDYYCAV